jgi:glutamate/tyrosine decarboxylase-like PLP-dependent enzyme
LIVYSGIFYIYIFLAKVFNLFGETNPLHADVFPDIRTMEAEVVRCVATMFHGDDNACGTVN